MKTNKMFKGVAAIVGGVIGLAIIGDIVAQETYDPADVNATGTFEEGSIQATTLNYLVPLMALGLLASAITVYKVA